MSNGSNPDKEESAVSLEFLSQEESLAAGTGGLPKSQEQKGPNMSFPVNMSLSNPIVREWVSKRREEIRPWGTFLKTSHFITPRGIPTLSKRLLKNVEYFQSNYFFVFIILFLYCLITSPLLLIVIAASAGACYILALRQHQRERPLVLAGREVSLPHQYALVGLCSIPLYLLAGAGSAVFWVIGASFFFIGLHAAFYNFDALDTVEDTAPLTGNIVEDV